MVISDPCLFHEILVTRLRRFSTRRSFSREAKLHNLKLTCFKQRNKDTLFSLPAKKRLPLLKKVVIENRLYMRVVAPRFLIRLYKLFFKRTTL